MEKPPTLLVIGGGSDIGRATAAVFARHGWTVRLAGRNEAALTREADDIAVRTGGIVTVHPLDVLATDSFLPFVAELPELPDVVVSAVGLLGSQPRAEEDPGEATRILRTNFEGPALLFGLIASRMALRGAGTLVGISSVAGDRGRASNYVYGAAKAGFSAFLSGLRNRLSRSGVQVVTVKPGFVRTRMTAGMRLPGVLTVNPDDVGDAIRLAVIRRQDVVYVARVWRPLMFAIRAIPERFFKEMKL